MASNFLASATGGSIPDSPWSEASRSYKNKYYVGPSKGYARFNYKKYGEGIKHVKNPALSFDKMFLSRYAPRAEVTGNKYQKALLSDWAGGAGGLGGAAIAQIIARNPASKEAKAAAKYNASLDAFSKLTKYRYEHFDDVTLAAFQAHGLSSKDIASLKAGNAIDPEVKASVMNHIASAKQFKNQRAKRGITSSPAFSALLTLAGAFNPVVAAGLGAAAGAASEGPIGAIKGGLKGYSVGSTLHKGFKLPDFLGGKQLLKPVVANGVPAGINPLDFAPGMKGTVAPNVGGATPAGSLGAVSTHGGNTGFVFGAPGGGGSGAGLIGGAGAGRAPGDAVIDNIENFDPTKALSNNSLSQGWQFGDPIPAQMVAASAFPGSAGARVAISNLNNTFWGSQFLDAASIASNFIPGGGSSSSGIKPGPSAGVKTSGGSGTGSVTGSGSGAGVGSGAGSEPSAKPTEVKDLDLEFGQALADLFSFGGGEPAATGSIQNIITTGQAGPSLADYAANASPRMSIYRNQVPQLVNA